ncbi:hypothetical protein POF45_01900 [Pseudomonas sp. 681]|uniref:Uncharacterized protein n=1 Tax=Pseudomonas fungipugnans TaxID=3024217 RepID=A0ABT6QH23_9PSED|nr:hypothetical protein [Pseudomonas sp. 681]MDI2590184.1 hypothetical protein [Pseudomonas sp. 681]
MSPLRDVLHKLLSGSFICQYTYPELHRQMRDADFAVVVENALAPLGRKLATFGEPEAPDTFFARYVDLTEAVDRDAATAQLVELRDQLRPCLEFIRLINRAGRSETCLAPGDTISFADMLDSIENHVTYRTQLWDLSGYDFFSKSKSGKDNKDRLSLVLRALADAGYLVKRSSESANYVATGKMGYVHTILAWIAEYNSLSLDVGTSDQPGGEQQGGLDL